MNNSKPPDFLILYDDQCALCHSFVQFLLKIDKDKRLFFAPRDGKTARQVCEHQSQRDLLEKDTVIAVQAREDGHKFFIFSDVALQTFKKLGWPWKFFWFFSVIPRFIRDGIYRFLSRHRYGIFGKADTCLMDSVKDSGQFLP